MKHLDVDEITTKEASFQLNDMTPKSRGNLTMKDVDIDVYYKTTPAAVPALYIKYQGDVVQHNQIVPGGTKDLLVAFSRVSREAREAIYKSVAELQRDTALALASKPGNSVLLGGSATPLVNGANKALCRVRRSRSATGFERPNRKACCVASGRRWRAESVVAAFAGLRGPVNQHDPTHQRNQPDQLPPTALADVMEAARPHGKRG